MTSVFHHIEPSTNANLGYAVGFGVTIGPRIEVLARDNRRGAHGADWSGTWCDFKWDLTWDFGPDLGHFGGIPPCRNAKSLEFSRLLESGKRDSNPFAI